MRQVLSPFALPVPRMHGKDKNNLRLKAPFAVQKSQFKSFKNHFAKKFQPTVWATSQACGSEINRAMAGLHPPAKPRVIAAAEKRARTEAGVDQGEMTAAGAVKIEEEEEGFAAKRARADAAEGARQVEDVGEVKAEDEEDEDDEVKMEEEEEEEGEAEEAVAELSASQVCTPRLVPPLNF